jgi:hypothetical protein
MRAGGKLLVRGIEWLIDWALERREQAHIRKAEKQRGRVPTFKDVLHVKNQSDAGAARRTKTVIIPRGK